MKNAEADRKKKDDKISPQNMINNLNKKSENQISITTKVVNLKNAIRDFNKDYAYEYECDFNRASRCKPHCSNINRECVSTGVTVEDSINTMAFINSITMVRMNLLSFYFSEANIRKDTFMIKNMDSNGWIPIRIVLDFHRLSRTKTTIEDLYNVNYIIIYHEN